MVNKNLRILDIHTAELRSHHTWNGHGLAYSLHRVAARAPVEEGRTFFIDRYQDEFRRPLSYDGR